MNVETRAKARPLFDPPILRRAVIDSFRKLDPRHQVRNPVMFVVEVGSLLTTLLLVQALMGQGDALRRARREVVAKKLTRPQYGCQPVATPAGQLRQGDVVLVEAGDFVP